MATTATATTPNATARHTTLAIGNNHRKHSVRTGSHQVDPDTRPDAPVFLDEPLFLQALAGNPVAGPSRLAKKPTAAHHQALEAIRVDDGPSTHLARKRTAGDVLDLTNTNTLSPESGATRQAKKARSTVTAATAVATDSKRRAKRAERAEKHEKMAQESAQWRAKYKKAFPSFTFYFDAVDEATKMQLSAQVKRLGASVDQFFSKKVTHVVTSRSLPSNSNKENVDSPAVPKNGAMLDSAAGKTKKLSIRSPKSYSLPNGQKLRPHSSDLEKNPFIDSQDILSKAMDFKLKIWHLEKLKLILSRINSHSPNKADPALQRDPSLPSLLRDEQLYGTRERDPFVPRSDMHYFSSNKYYLLVEDSTGEHRPIVIKEYDKVRKHEDPSWPILYGGVEGRGGFYKYEGPPIVYEPRVPPPPQAAPPAAKNQLMAGFSTTAARAVAPNLRRSVSLQNVTREGQAGRESTSKNAAPGGLHRRDSYIAASGNSQTITSNIASATSTRSGAAMQPNGSRFGNGTGPFVDKRLAILSNRTVSMSMSGAGGSGGNRLASVKAQGKLKRSVSVDAGLNVKMPPPRDEPKKPGYCENCRIKYDDFKDHVISSKHRRFALNPKNWAELDLLLDLIARRPATLESVMPPSPSSRSSSNGSSPVRVSEADDSGFFEVQMMMMEEEEENECGTDESDESRESSAAADSEEGDE
ncbi:hypothetical protein JCM5296_001689 [Sporobolomyces johnsonii]